MEKSSVSLTVKQSSVKGGGIGFEINCIAVEGVTDEILKDLSEKASKACSDLLKKSLFSQN